VWWKDDNIDDWNCFGSRRKHPELPEAYAEREMSPPRFLAAFVRKFSNLSMSSYHFKLNPTSRVFTNSKTRPWTLSNGSKIDLQRISARAHYPDHLNELPQYTADNGEPHILQDLGFADMFPSIPTPTLLQALNDIPPNVAERAPKAIVRRKHGKWVYSPPITFPRNSHQAHLQSHDDTDLIDPLEAFLTLRSRSFPGNAIPPSTLLKLAEFALDSNLGAVFNIILQDALAPSDRSLNPESSERLGLIHGLLALCSRHTEAPICSNELVLQLFRALPSDPAAALNSLPMNVIAHVTKALISSPSSSSEHLPLVLQIYEILLQPPATSASSTSSGHSTNTWLLFRILIYLVETDERQRALSLFKSLVSSARIPDSALQHLATTDLLTGGDEDVYVLIKCALAYACLGWGWWGRCITIAEELVVRHRESAVAPSLSAETAVRSLVSGVTQSFINSSPLQKVIEPSKFVKFVIAATTAPRPIAFNPILLQELYTYLSDPSRIQLLSSLYTHLQLTSLESLSEPAKPLYPPPTASALLSLLGYLTSAKGDPNLARILVRSRPPVPSTHRAAYIRQLAQTSFAREARLEWESCDVTRRGEDAADQRYLKEAVWGSAKVAIAMVKLFVGMRDGEVEKVRVIEAAKGLSQSSDGLQEPQSSKSANAIVSDGESDANTLQSRDAKIICPDVIQPTNGIRVRSGKRWRLQTDVLLRSKIRARDYDELARRVATEFTALKHPLSHASHLDLNAHAHISLILDQRRAAFQSLQVILKERREYPDSQDMNVWLSGFARYDPRRAGRIMFGALERGIVQPEDIRHGWSAILHEALSVGDMELAGELVRRALGSKGVLGNKSFDSTLRNLLRLASTLPAKEKAQLMERILKVIEFARKAGMNLHPSLSRFTTRESRGWRGRVWGALHTPNARFWGKKWGSPLS
jgi:hypothetical protein